MTKSGVNPPFIGPVSEGFILGVLQASFTRSVSITALKERVLWQWDNSRLFIEVNNAVGRLVQRNLVTFQNDEVKLITE